MKKLLSFLAVAAIVTSAFAFTTKGVANFCVQNVAETACVVINNKKIVTTGGDEFFHYPMCPGQWDGTRANCTGLTNCSQSIFLDDN